MEINKENSQRETSPILLVFIMNDGNFGNYYNSKGIRVINIGK